MFNNLLLRWSIGSQDTVLLSDAESAKIQQMIWLTKLSIKSFQRWFPGAQCVLLYNGEGFDNFCHLFDEMWEPVEVQIFNQFSGDPRFTNRYHFVPRGVWWKWLPFRFDPSKTEIAVDTDIICIDKPQTWYDWLDASEEILVAPERYENVLVNTCGDLYKHPILRGKKPFNCGIVGQRAGFDFTERFFEISHSVRFGETHDSMFITEQGAINVWARSLESDGHRLYTLDFNKNAWVRDFLYFLHRGVRVETIHAVMWHKNIIYALREVFERIVGDPDYNMKTFTSDLIRSAGSLDRASKYILSRQLGFDPTFSVEFLPSN